MHIKDNPDFKTVWQLAHDLADEESDKTDPNAIAPRLRIVIDCLIRTIGGKEISGGWKGYRIFYDNSIFSFIFDFRSMSYGFVCSSYTTISAGITWIICM